MSRILPTITALVIVIMALAGPAHAGEVEVAAWSYYKFAPFVTGEKKGLMYDFVALLNEGAVGRYRFTAELLPRKRLDYRIAGGEQGIVLFVNGVWMGDPEQKRYLWTPPILSDRNEVISRMSGQKPVRVIFDGPASLGGMRLGGVLGRKYKGLEEAIARGDILREDARGADHNLKKLLFGRIDIMSAPGTMLHYLVREMALEDKIFFSPNPLFSHTRHLLVTKKLEEVHGFLDGIVAALPENARWQAIKEKYGVR